MERFRLRSQRMEIRSVRSAIKFIHWMEQILTQKEKSKEEDGKVTLELGTALDQSAQEAVLKLTLTLGSGEAQKKGELFHPDREAG